MAKSSKLALLPPISRPWPVAILALDPSKSCSGAALLLPSHLLDVVVLPEERAKPTREHSVVWAHDVSGARREKRMLELIAGAQQYASLRGLPLVVVAEKWTGHGKFGGARTQRGLGEGFAEWRMALAVRGFHSEIVRVVPSRWYAAVIGGKKRRDDKQTVVQAMLRRFPHLGPDLGDDAAEAVAIGLWASLAGEVGMVVPATLLREHLASLRDPGLLAEIERRRGLVSSDAKSRVAGKHADLVVVDETEAKRR